MLLAVAVWVLPVAALAQSAPEDESAGAQEIFQLGQRAAEDHRWDEAARYFARAYELSQEPVLIYNVGVAYERAGATDEAIEWLERYLAQGGDVPRRAEVQERLSVLRGSVERGSDPDVEPADEPSATPAATAEPVSDDEGTGANVGALVLIGVGAATAVAGAVFLGLAAGSAGTVNDAASSRMRYWDEVSGDASNVSTFSVVGGVLVGVGAAAALAGLTWLLVGGGDDAPEANVAAAPGGFVVWGRF